MPRHTHPPAKAKHSRAHQRFHRDRIIARRWAQAKRLAGDSASSPAHPEDLRGASPLPAVPDRVSVFTRPVGELDNEQAWVGCRRAQCGLCRDPDASRGRHAQDRAWRAYWEL